MFWPVGVLDDMLVFSISEEKNVGCVQQVFALLHKS